MKHASINWDHYRSFLAVIDCNSLSGAAKILGLTQPTVGRHIDALEIAVGVPLFVRSRYGLSPTEPAMNMVPHTKAMASAARAIERVTSQDAETRGTIRLTVSEIIGVEVLPDILWSFAQDHPHIRIELVLTNRTENLLRREADIAVRMKRPTQEALVARKIGDIPIRLYAHESYINTFGVPKTAAEIGRHRAIGPDSLSNEMDITGNLDLGKLHSGMVLKSDSDLAQLALIRAGCGIGGIQVQLAARNPQLIPVLHNQFSIDMEMWLVTHEDMIGSRPVRLFFDHLARHLSAYVRQQKTGN